MAVFILLYKFVYPVTILGWMFHIGVILYLINRNEIPEFKLPWLLIFCIVPVMGAYAQADYLYYAAGMPCYENSITTYYPVGEEFHAALLNELQKAEIIGRDYEDFLATALNSSPHPLQSDSMNSMISEFHLR